MEKLKNLVCIKLQIFLSVPRNVVSLLHTASPTGFYAVVSVFHFLLLLFFCNCRDQQVRLDRWEIGATLDPQAHLVSRVYLELREKKEPR